MNIDPELFDMVKFLASSPLFSGLLQEEWVVGIQENDPLQSMVLERYQETRSHEWTYKWGLIWRYLHKILVNSNPVKLQAIKT